MECLGGKIWHLTSHILCPELWQVKHYFDRFNICIIICIFMREMSQHVQSCSACVKTAYTSLLSPCTRSTKLYFLLYSTLAVSVAFKATFSSRLDFYQSCRFCQFVALTVDVDFKKKLDVCLIASHWRSRHMCNYITAQNLFLKCQRVFAMIKVGK